MDSFSVRVSMNDEDILNLIGVKETLIKANIDPHRSLKYEILTVSYIIDNYIKNSICYSCPELKLKDKSGEKYPQNCLTYLENSCAVVNSK